MKDQKPGENGFIFVKLLGKTLKLLEAMASEN